MSEHGHDHPLDRLSAYLDGELTDDERASVEDHLAACPDCRLRLAAWRRLAAAVHGEALPGVPEGLQERIESRLDAASVVPFRRRFAIPATIAATIGAIGLVAVIALRQQGQPVVPQEPPSNAPAADAKIAAPAAPPPTAAERLKDSGTKFKGPAPAPRQKNENAVASARRDAPADLDRGGVAGGAVGGVEKARESDKLVRQEAEANEQSASRVQGAAAPSVSKAVIAADRPATCGDDVVDAPAAATWLVRDLDVARRQLVGLVEPLGGVIPLQDPALPETVVVVLPASRYVAFTAQAGLLGVVGLDNAQAPPGALCVRQSIVVRRVAVN
jgi:anti-sigma factor RsiW